MVREDIDGVYRTHAHVINTDQLAEKALHWGEVAARTGNPQSSRRATKALARMEAAQGNNLYVVDRPDRPDRPRKPR